MFILGIGEGEAVAPGVERCSYLAWYKHSSSWWLEITLEIISLIIVIKRNYRLTAIPILPFRRRHYTEHSRDTAVQRQNSWSVLGDLEELTLHCRGPRYSYGCVQGRVETHVKAGPGLPVSPQLRPVHASRIGILAPATPRKAWGAWPWRRAAGSGCHRLCSSTGCCAGLLENSDALGSYTCAPRTHWPSQVAAQPYMAGRSVYNRQPWHRTRRTFRSGLVRVTWRAEVRCSAATNKGLLYAGALEPSCLLPPLELGCPLPLPGEN